MKDNNKAQSESEKEENKVKSAESGTQAQSESKAAQSATEKGAKGKNKQAKTKKEDVEEKLCRQLKDKDEQIMRIAAEYDNFRRRSIKEKEENFLNAKVSVISDFLDVIDNFQRAKDAECEFEDYRKGVELIFTQFYDKMKKLGVEEFGAAGEKFDPEIHMAVMHIDDDSAGENEITEVFQKGYKIGDKIVRHAMVKVAN